MNSIAIILLAILIIVIAIDQRRVRSRIRKLELITEQLMTLRSGATWPHKGSEAGK